MAHTYALGQARASSAGNPITFSYTVSPGDTVVAVLMEVGGATDRAGGALTWGEITLTQASTAQKAAASPEAGAELWYLLNPLHGTKTLTIPNTGALTIKYTVAVGRAKAGGRSQLVAAAGTNNTSTNPAPGAIVPKSDGAIGFACVATGAQTWNPSAQAGTVIANTDDGAFGGGEQYLIQGTAASINLGWTFGTSDDWGAVAVFFDEVPPNSLQNFMRAKGNNGGSIGGLG